MQRNQQLHYQRAEQTGLKTAVFELTSGAMERHKGRSSLISGEFIDGLQTRIIVKHSLRDYLHNGNVNWYRSAVFFSFISRVRRSSLKVPPPHPRFFQRSELRGVASDCVCAGRTRPQRGRVIPPRCWRKEEKASNADNL